MAGNLWQLYDTQGRPTGTYGAPKHQVAVQGLLHGAVHVWFWRPTERGTAVLIQKRALCKINWPGLLDKSAGGHIAFQETPLACAVRQTREELGITLESSSLTLVNVAYWHTPIADTGLVEHEYQWVYITRVPEAAMTPAPREVHSLLWKDVAQLASEVTGSGAQRYVPYGRAYFLTVCRAIQAARSASRSRVISS